jgi:hypothetical protein
VNKFADPIGQSAVAEIERSLDIGVDVSIWGTVRMWYCDQSSEMKDDIDILGEPKTEVRITYVTGYDRYLVEARDIF